jgi:hypothetical protein
MCDVVKGSANENSLRPVEIALVATPEGKYDESYRSYESWTPFIFKTKTAIVKWYISDDSEVLLDIGRPYKVSDGQFHTGFHASIVRSIDS